MLLILQKICNQKAIKLPWDEVGSQLGGTITGGAIVQHLAKLRAKRVELGLPVPEPLKRGSGGSMVNSTGTAIGSGDARKGRQGKRPAASSLNTSNEDDEEEYDVDKASDPDASFEEVRKKKAKRNVEDGTEEDNYSMVTKPKGGKARKTSKARKKIGTKSLEATKQNLKEESSPEMSSVTTSERAGRRSSVNYARLHNGESESDADEEMNEPHVAAGSSFLRLEGVGPLGHQEGTATNHDEAENMENDEEVIDDEDKVSREASVLPEQDNNEEKKVAVLQLGKSERSVDFLKALDGSYTSTALPRYAIPAVVENAGPLPVNFGRRASMSLGFSGVSGAITGNDFNHSYSLNHDSMDLPPVYRSQAYTSPYANTFTGYSSAQYSSAMPEVMHPTPVMGHGSTGLPGEFFGSNMNNRLYSHPYGGGRSEYLMTGRSPASGNYPHYNEYVPGGLYSNVLPSRLSQSNLRTVPSRDMSTLTGNNSMPATATMNVQQNVQNYAQINNQEEIDLNQGEVLTDINPFSTSEQHDPILGYHTGLSNDFLGGESFGPVFDRFVRGSDDDDI